MFGLAALAGVEALAFLPLLSALGLVWASTAVAGLTLALRSAFAAAAEALLGLHGLGGALLAAAAIPRALARFPFWAALGLVRALAAVAGVTFTLRSTLAAATRTRETLLQGLGLRVAMVAVVGVAAMTVALGVLLVPALALLPLLPALALVGTLAAVAGLALAVGCAGAAAAKALLGRFHY